MTNQLSDEMKATAAALQRIRRQLYQMMAESGLPNGCDFADVSAVLVQGLDVLLALDRLAR
jgi:hypothetical protein